MSKPLKWGIMGTGNIAGQFARGLSGSDYCIATAAASRDKAKAEQFAATQHAGQGHGSYEALLADSNVDAVYIALPNSMHHEWTLRALAAGKHVLCEKPLASNAAEAEEMFDAAQKAGLHLVEAFMYRSHPMTLAVKAKLDQGAIGELRFVRTSFCFHVRKPDGNVRFDPSLAGGGLMDVGCYCLDFSRYMAGSRISKLQAIGHLHESGVDDLVSGSLEFENGVMASFTCGMTMETDNSAVLSGSDGFIQIPIPWKPLPPMAEFTVGRMTPPKMDMAKGVAAPSGPMRETYGIRINKPLYAIEADDFAKAVNGEAPPAVPAEDSLANMRALDELRKQIGLSF